MHITHVVAHPPFREGTGTVCYYNVRALEDLGCNVRVYSTRPDGPRGLDGRTPEYRWLRSWLSIGNAYLTPDLLGMEKTDVIHLHFPFIFGSELTVLRSRLAKAPMVLTYHNDLIGNGIRRPLFWLYNHLDTPLILRQARRIIVTSFDYARTSIYARTVFERRRRDLVEVGNGVDVETFRPGIDGAGIRSRHAIGLGDVLLLFVSSLDRSHARKGLDLLLEALAELPDPRLRLIIVGDGDGRQDYERQAGRLGVEARLAFAGRVDQAELPAYYSACDMVVVPSRPPEAFGMALAQGMATGKPVVGSDIPGVRSLVQNGEQGFLVPPGDRKALAAAMTVLAGDPGLRARLGAAGRQRVVQTYSWKAAAEKLLAVYQDVLAR